MKGESGLVQERNLHDVRSLYLGLIKKCLMGLMYGDMEDTRENSAHVRSPRPASRLLGWINRSSGKDAARSTKIDLSARLEGRDWPTVGHTMIGLKRLENIQYCVESVIADRVPGDLIETGVWRGGATIFMRSVLKSYDVKDRCVWVADSFRGLPAPNLEKYPEDAGMNLFEFKELAISLEDVMANFAAYGLLDEQVKFLPGWFRDTLPTAPIEELAVIRLDGDLYESTMDALTGLYSKLSVGGYLIVDDYGMFAACRKAVHDFRERNGVMDEIIPIDHSGVYWRKGGEIGDRNRQTGIKTQQADGRDFVISHFQKLLTEREETIQSLTAQLSSVRMSGGRLALRKLRGVYERSRLHASLSKAASDQPTLIRVSTRPNGDHLKGAGLEAVAHAERLAKALLNRSRAGLKELRGADVRAIAFYLPQFHPIPENDQWWGRGFTEWTNVTKARPNFEGHYQPHLPADLGFYDLRVPEAREQQAELAREYGVHGFCYYHYWYGGRRLLERPFNELLSSGRPDFPFCLCWANHNWTRRWDGAESEILIAQQYSDEDDRNFIRSLFPAFEDHRYIRVNDKPLLLVYQVTILPNAKQTAAIWRAEMKKAGLGEIYLCAVQSHGNYIDPMHYEFDGAVEFPPHGLKVSNLKSQIANVNPDFEGFIGDYMASASSMIHRPKPDYTRFKGVMPGWDNTARQQDAPQIFINSSPEAYEYWLGKAVEHMITYYRDGERLVFINAWNEWSEGAHLEPDRRYGRRYLEATRNVLSIARRNNR